MNDLIKLTRIKRNSDTTKTKSNLSTQMFLWPFISGLIFTSNAQYSAPLLASTTSNAQHLQLAAAGYCDANRLLRCQQDTSREMQLTGLNAASIQYPISSGPPYSPAAKLRESQAAAVTSQATCRLVRSNLDCMLATTPACYEAGLQAAFNSDLILRAKRFLEQNGCNEPDSSWQLTLCYRAPELRLCEERYGFTVFGSGSSLSVANASTCFAYQSFKNCVDSHARLNCKVYEIDMENEYLIDRAGDLAWRCPHTNTTSSSSLHYGSYGLANGPSGQLLSPVSAYNSLGNYHRDNYEQRPVPTYVGSSSLGSNNLFNGVLRDQPAWERFRNPYDDTRIGISRLPSVGGSGEVFDRLVAGTSGFEAELSDCPPKAAPFARECEDTLNDQQRLARDSRDGNELQRRICCSLFQYRDCVSRVVLDRCADSSPAAVEVLMGIRRREMVVACRGFNRDLCSGALAIVSSPMLVLAASLVAILITFKQQQSQQ